MSKPLLQLDLFGGPAVLVVPQPPPPEPVPPPPAPVLPLPGQLSLEGARWTRLSALFDALLAGRFDAAAAGAAALRGEQGVAAALAALAVAIAGCADAEALAGLDLAPLCAPLVQASAASLATAAARGRAALVARALGDRLEARAQGLLAASWWEAAGDPARALAALDLLLASRPHHAGALVLRGNALLRRGERARARDEYRLALRSAPASVSLQEIADDEVRLLALEAEELGLAPVEPWLPFVGLPGGVFALEAVLFERPPTPADRFEAALLACRASRAWGRIDVAARRELKGLAPKLFARLLEEGLA
jgi:tetratricopeptide (TPR) repeat protein